MELTPALLSGSWKLAGAIVFTAGLALACRRAPWCWLARGAALQRLAASGTAVLLVWLLRAAPEGGPVFHLLGATLLTLAFGWQLAVIALGCVLAATVLAGVGAFSALGVNGTINVIVPVAVSYAWARASERLLPPNPFVYLFCSAFFGAFLAVTAVALGAAAVLHGAGVLPVAQLYENYLPTAMLLLFPEAFLTGSLLTLAVVYRPGWVVSWDDPVWLDRA